MQRYATGCKITGVTYNNFKLIKKVNILREVRELDPLY